MMGKNSEEEAILRSQQLDWIYSQSSILYKILQNTHRPEMDTMKETPGLHAHRVIGSMVI